ncbi:EF-hand calcium-binding domain-containing protein 6 [Strongylocentrotus purpuratus]|uniref:EF-hand domain-containing protein n=1 Tax=Strongylocentrotus purpuratus TaxID=7668 RepID=A0A7M7G1G2_STRPU|nr:EF-hand calcium-binding domain-containing protein 6 [Strongylocentrotus purpuratus]
MATGIVSNQRNASGFKKQNLPNIEHPMSRLGDRKSMNVTGSNRPDSVMSPRPRQNSSGREARTPPLAQAGRASVVGLHAWDEPDHNLPPLQKDGGKENKRSKKQKHSRMMTWPPAHEQGPGERRAKSAKVPSSAEFLTKYSRNPDELIQVLRVKLVSGFHGLRQMFKGHDPQGKGRVSKSAMGQILYPLIGYITHEDVARLLHRLGLERDDTLTFDDFIACFRDTEVVQREWLSPVAKKRVAAERRKLHPEEHLRDKDRALPHQKCTAVYGNALLKEKCKHSDFDIRKYLAPSCFEPGGTVLGLQLQECLALLGGHLDDEEMTKLWSRYDIENTGALDSAWFFIQLGLDGNGRYNPRARTAPPSRRQKYSQLPSTPRIQEEEELDFPESPRIPTPPSNGRQSNSRMGPARALSADVVSFIIRKLEQPFNNLMASFQMADNTGNGLLGIEQFKKVLCDYGIKMQYVDAEMMMERCGLRRKDGRVMYRDFLLKYMMRSANGIAHRIIMDSSHKFNTRLNTPQGYLCVDEAEAKLVELIHKDFLSLLGMFKSLDVYNLGLLTQRDFKDTVEKVFNIRMSKDQFNEILYEYGQEDGLVQYSQFLTVFNRRRFIPFQTQPKVQNNQHETSPPDIYRVQESPDGEDQEDEMGAWLAQSAANQEEAMETSRPVIGGGKTKKMEGRYKPVSEIAAEVEIQLKKKGYTVQDSYNRLDPKYTGRLSKTQFYKWLSDMGIALHPSELQELWKAMDIARDGLVHYAELFDFFLHRTKRQPIADKEASLRRAKAGNQPPPVRNSSEMKEMMELYKIPVSTVVEKIRPDVVSNWNGLKERLKSLDPQGYATISTPDFQRLAQRFQFRLTPRELERLTMSFDHHQTGNFHYIDFLRLFSESKKPAQHGGQAYHRNFHKITHQTSKGPEEVTVTETFDKIGRKILGDWRSIRRAFKKADLNGDGHLSIPEFRRILANMKVNIAEEDFYHIVSEVDENMDGNISYEEFLAQLMPR